MKVDEGDALLHRLTQPHVVVVEGVVSAIAIAQEVVGTDFVIVGTRGAFDGRDCGDSKRDFGEDGRLKNTLGAHERDTLSLIEESFR
jgi:hypothetical protein